MVKVTRSLKPASPSRLRPTSTISGLMSNSVAAQPVPPARRTRRVRSPVPPATSSSRNAAPISAAPSSRHIILPEPVQAARHQVVHQVVASGDGREDTVDQPLALALGHALEAEGDGVACGDGLFFADVLLMTGQ